MTRPAEQPGYEYMAFGDFEELLADRPAHEKWELIGGRVVRMMVGAHCEHNLLVQNVSAAIRKRLRQAGSPCRTFTETFYLKDAALDAALLPDVMVHCGPLPKGATSAGAPVALVEIVSAGSEARDRVSKWQVYQQLPSLQHYVLVSQDRAHVESYDGVGGEWQGLRVIHGLSGHLTLPAIDVAVPLREIYRDVLEAVEAAPPRVG